MLEPHGNKRSSQVFLPVRRRHPQADGTASKVAFAPREAKQRKQKRSDTCCMLRCSHAEERPSSNRQIPSLRGSSQRVTLMPDRRPVTAGADMSSCNSALGATNPTRTSGCAAKSSCSGRPAETLLPSAPQGGEPPRHVMQRRRMAPGPANSRDGPPGLHPHGPWHSDS